jgi:hypothetical protein
MGWDRKGAPRASGLGPRTGGLERLGPRGNTGNGNEREITGARRSIFHPVLGPRSTRGARSRPTNNQQAAGNPTENALLGPKPTPEPQVQ